MKKNFTLNNLAKNTMKEKEMNLIRGGFNDMCRCSCCYAGSGGSSIADNGMANSKLATKSKPCPNN